MPALKRALAVVVVIAVAAVAVYWYYNSTAQQPPAFSYDSSGIKASISQKAPLEEFLAGNIVEIDESAGVARGLSQEELDALSTVVSNERQDVEQMPDSFDKNLLLATLDNYGFYIELSGLKRQLFGEYASIVEDFESADLNSDDNAACLLSLEISIFADELDEYNALVDAFYLKKVGIEVAADAEGVKPALEPAAFEPYYDENFAGNLRDIEESWGLFCE